MCLGIPGSWTSPHHCQQCSLQGLNYHLPEWVLSVRNEEREGGREGGRIETKRGRRGGGREVV